MKRLCVVLLLAGVLRADVSIPRVLVELERDIRTETIALTQARGEIADERRALSADLAEREARVQQLRNELENARRVRRQSGEEVQRQRQELTALRQLELDVRAMTREARRGLEARLPQGLLAEIADQIETADLELAQEGSESAMRAGIGILRAFIAANELLTAPRELTVKALQADGLELEGVARFIGPLSWFRSAEAGAGFLLEHPGQGASRFLPHPGPGLDLWFGGGAAEIPFDLSGGRALMLRDEARPWWDSLRDGGLTMIPLALTALAAAILIFWKTLALHGVKGHDPASIQAVASALREENKTLAAETLAAVPAPLRTLLAGALAHPGADAEELEELMHERMLGIIPQLDRHLGTLAVLGGIAPLLGLLGTVTGMIHTFELVTLFGSGNERILSQGISEALVTTMSGLIIAVPVLLAHAFLSRRVRVILGELEQSIAAFIHARHRAGEGKA